MVHSISQIPLLKRTIDIYSNLNISLEFIRKFDFTIERFIPPPWFSIEKNISTLFIQSKKQDIDNEQAIQTYNFIKHTDYAHFSKFYTDGSKQDNGDVGSAVYVDEISSSFSWKLDSHHSILTAELFAIYQAALFSQKHLKNQKIVIFSDSLSALTIISHYNNNSSNILVNLIIKLIYESSIDGGDIVLQWIPSHRGIVGNNIADLVAKEACSYSNVTFLPLTYNDNLNLLNHKIFNNKIVHWHNVKAKLKFYKSVPDIKSWEWITLNKRSYDALLARFRSGCTDLNEHLYKIKLETAPFCKFCTTETETVEHYIFNCAKYNNYRTMLIEELAKLDIEKNKINLHLLLTGGEGPKKKRIKILRIFVNYVKLTGRFDIK